MYTLADGHGLYPMPDGSWHYLTATESAFRIGAPTALVAELDAHLTDPRRELGSDAAELAQALATRGVLTAAAPDPGPPTGTPRIVVEGTGTVARYCADLLRAAVSGGRVETVGGGTVDEDVVASATVLVSLAPFPPDSHWSRVDRWCRTHGTGWHRAAPEGDAVGLGPFTVPGGASYTDLRFRRLAASGVADDLEAWWRHLDRRACSRWDAHPACAAHVAALLTADVATWIRGSRSSNTLRQLRIDPVTAAVTAHPVLPLPVAPVAG